MSDSSSKYNPPSLAPSTAANDPLNENPLVQQILKDVRDVKQENAALKIEVYNANTRITDLQQQLDVATTAGSPANDHHDAAKPPTTASDAAQVKQLSEPDNGLAVSHQSMDADVAAALYINDDDLIALGILKEPQTTQDTQEPSEEQSASTQLSSQSMQPPSQKQPVLSSTTQPPPQPPTDFEARFQVLEGYKDNIWSRFNGQQSAISKMETKIEQQDRQIDNLETERKRLNHRINDLESEHERQDARINDLETELSRRIGNLESVREMQTNRRLDNLEYRDFGHVQPVDRNGYVRYLDPAFHGSSVPPPFTGVDRSMAFDARFPVRDQATGARARDPARVAEEARVARDAAVAAQGQAQGQTNSGRGRGRGQSTPQRGRRGSNRGRGSGRGSGP